MTCGPRLRDGKEAEGQRRKSHQRERTCRASLKPPLTIELLTFPLQPFFEIDALTILVSATDG